MYLRLAFSSGSRILYMSTLVHVEPQDTGGELDALVALIDLAQPDEEYQAAIAPA
jgi:hypothetical protein